MKEKKIYRFEDLKKDITQRLKERSLVIGIKESVAILEGFVMEPFKTELTGEFTVGGPTVPMVMLIGNESGRVYFFALKALLPELEL